MGELQGDVKIDVFSDLKSITNNYTGRLNNLQTLESINNDITQYLEEAFDGKEIFKHISFNVEIGQTLDRELNLIYKLKVILDIKPISEYGNKLINSWAVINALTKAY